MNSSQQLHHDTIKRNQIVKFYRRTEINMNTIEKLLGAIVTIKSTHICGTCKKPHYRLKEHEYEIFNIESFSKVNTIVEIDFDIFSVSGGGG